MSKSREHEKKQEEEKPKEDFKSIKVKSGTYEKLKNMGMGISKAVDTLTEAKAEAVSEKIGEISAMGEQMAGVLLESGILDIKFKGVGIESVKEVGNVIQINGYVKVEIPDEETRKAIIEVFENGPIESEE